MKLPIIAAAATFVLTAGVGAGVGMQRAKATNAAHADSVAKADSAHADSVHADSAQAESDASVDSAAHTSDAATTVPNAVEPVGVPSQVAGGPNAGSTHAVNGNTEVPDGTSPSRPVSPVADSIGRLSKLFTAMSARDAAEVFEQMSDADVVTILRGMTDRRAGEILAALPPARSAVIARAMLVHTGRAQ